MAFVVVQMIIPFWGKEVGQVCAVRTSPPPPQAGGWRAGGRSGTLSAWGGAESHAESDAVLQGSTPWRQKTEKKTGESLEGEVCTGKRGGAPGRCRDAT